MKKIIITILLFMMCYMLAAQEKAPVAEDDFASTNAMQPVTINVLENDFAYDEHDFKISIAFPPYHGHKEYTDSTIIYTSDYYFGGLDSLMYQIVDLENGLLSEMATVFIQVENKGYDTLDINNVRARINSFGLHFWDMEDNILFEIPAYSGKNTIFCNVLWLGAVDDQGLLHVAADRYHFYGGDFWPGPVMDSTEYCLESDVEWNRVWKISQSEIDEHRANWQNQGYEPPENILAWPGNGDTLKGQAYYLAPYFDYDENDSYDATKGDFPLIKGDQAVFFIINDDRHEHTETGGRKLRAEIHGLFYAFDKPEKPDLNNSVFVNYKIFNRSETYYPELYIGNFVDFDIGYPWDDYIGCDTILQAYYGYNGLEIDGSGEPGSYGAQPPAQGVTFLNVELNHFMYFENYSGPTSDPYADYEYFNYMKSVWKDSTHLTYGGTGYGGVSPVNYAFPGDPLNQNEWTECSVGNEPGDKRGVGSSGPVEFAPGQMIELDIAYVFARTSSGNNLSSVELLKESIKSVREFYESSLDIPKNHNDSYDLNVYPNPFIDKLCIDGHYLTENTEFLVYDILGEVVCRGKLSPGIVNNVSLKELQNGLYFLTIWNGHRLTTKKIIKNGNN